MTNHHQCYKCSDKAVWFYMPSDGDPDKRYLCNTCVKHGCSCWWISNIEYQYKDCIVPKSDTLQLIKFDDGYEYRNLLGEQLPCCEYDYCAEGFEIEERNDYDR